MIKKLLGLFSKDMAMDLGTANTLIYLKGKGIVVNEPSVLAYYLDNNKVMAVGSEAKSYIGRTPKGVEVVRPLKDGVISDFDMAQKLIKILLEKAYKRTNIFKPRLIVCVPSGITQVEKKAVIDASLAAGAREVFLIEEPMAAAIGAELEIDKPKGSMIIDIGGGTTEVAVISLFSIAYSESIRVAGDEMDEAISRYLQKKYRVLVGENQAEEIKIRWGSAYPMEDDGEEIEITGKDIVDGIPKKIQIKKAELREALKEPVNAIVEAVKRALEKTPPELASDIFDKGIVLTGGGSLLRGLDKLISENTGLYVQVAQDPLTSVVLGTGKALEKMKLYKRVFIN